MTAQSVIVQQKLKLGGKLASYFSTVENNYPTEVSFHLEIFLKETAIMLLFSFFGPFSYLPLYYLCGGVDGMKMRLFVGKGSISQFMMWVFVAIPLCLFHWTSSAIKEEIIWLISVVCSRCVMIGTKYSYMSERYYSVINSYSPQNEKVLRSQQIGVSWVVLSPELIEEQISIAMRRNNLTEKKMEMEQLIECANDQCPIELPEYISGYNLCFEWIQNSNTQVKPNIKYPILMSLFMSHVPIIAHIFRGELSTASNASDVIAVPLISLSIFVVEAAHFLFLYTSYLDVKRRLYRMKLCSTLIAPSHSVLRNRKTTEIDVKSLKHLSNSASTIHGWIHLRRVLIDFGKDYLSRLAAYYSISFGMIVGACFTLFVQVVYTSPTTIFLSQNISLILNVLIMLSFIIWLIVLGDRLNKENLIQTDVLLEYSRNIECQLVSRQHIDQRREEEIRVTLTALQSAREQLRVDFDLRPFKILGVRASSIMIKLILSIFASYVVFIFRFSSSNLF